MSHVRAQSEEEARQMTESQARALEELAKKHRVTLENALNSAEKDKNRLLTVSTHTHPHICIFVRTFINMIHSPAPYANFNHPM